MACERALLYAPLEAFQVGPINNKPVSAEEKIKLADRFQQEWTEMLAVLGFTFRSFSTGSGYAGGDDYVPDGDDETNLLWTDTDEGTISQWN